MISVALYMLAQAACDIDQQLVTLDQLVIKENLKSTKLDDGALTAFNAELARETNGDVSQLPPMDTVIEVTVPQDDNPEDNNAALFAFKDGCQTGAMVIPASMFTAILEKTQAGR